MKKIFYITLFSILSLAEIQALLVTGDPDATTGNTFSFNVGFGVFDLGSDQSLPRLWVANNDPSMNTYPDTVLPYGLSFINQLASFVPSNIKPVATPMVNDGNATIILSTSGSTTPTSTSVPNPLWGGTFSFFDVSMQKPAFVLTSSPNSVYVVQNIEHYANPTEKQQNITQLLQYQFTTANEQIDALVSYGDTIFLAHSQGAFGSSPSFITEVTKSTTTINDIMTPYLKLTVDTPINITVPALTAGTNDLAALGSSVTMKLLFNSFYIGIDATANAAAGSCACALTFATLIANESSPTGYDIQFNQIAPSNVLNPGYNTVFSATTNNEIRITNITGMATSTGLQYLIVAQDSGPGTGAETIYAVPVISTGPNIGQIATFTSIQNNFGTKPLLFLSRQFDTVISDPTEIEIGGMYNAQLQVGGGTTLSNCEIEQLYSVGDSIYIVIGDQYGEGTPGTFQSQAIFAQDGHIIGWSPWQRVLGTDQQTKYSFIDRKTLSGFYIAASTPGATPNFQSVYQTTFVNNSNLSPLLGQAPLGGIQALFNFPQSTPGFNDALSLMISVGYGTCVIGQTGITNSGNFMINQPMSVTDTIAFVDAQLNNQGALVAAEIAHDTNNNYHWIFVGGATGVSVLTNDTTGVTWSGNLANINTGSLNAGQNFKTVGNFTFVKKLVWDSSSTYLYILTSNELYRILLDPNKFTATPTVDLNPELILQASTLSKFPNYFLDIIIDNGFCVIGTANGLYTMNVTTGQSVEKIIVPNGLPAASQLIVVSQAAEPQRSFESLSNLFVLNNSFGTQQARLNRFTITNGSIVPFDDFLSANLSNGTFQGFPTSFVKFDTYISSYFTDGTWNMASSYFLGPNQPNNTMPLSVLQLFTGIRSGFSSSQMILPSFSGYAPLLFLLGGTNIAYVIRESTSGALIIPGNFPTYAYANV